MADAASPYAPGTVGDEPAAPRAPVRPALFLIAALAMSLAGPGVLWYPWRHLLIRSGVADDRTVWLELLVLAPPLFSLFWGMLSDRWAIMDARREGHLFCAALLAAVAWAGLLIVPHSVPPLLVGVVITAAHSIANVAVGGALAEIGRREAKTGRFAAIWGVTFAAAHLAGHTLRGSIVPVVVTIWLSVGLAAFVAIAMVVSLGTDPVPAPVAATAARTPLRPHLRTRALWAAAVVVILAVIARVPDSAIAPAAWPRPLGRVVLIGRLVGPIVYAFACRRLRFARGLRLGLVVNVVVTISVMRASEQTSIVLALMVAAIGLVEGFKFAALDDLIFRAAPPGHEASICALLSAVAAVGWTVSKLTADTLRLSISGMTSVSVVAGAAALLLVSRLPASLTSGREGAPPQSHPAEPSP